jgi:hypothetical protein
MRARDRRAARESNAQDAFRKHGLACRRCGGEGSQMAGELGSPVIRGKNAGRSIIRLFRGTALATTDRSALGRNGQFALWPCEVSYGQRSLSC